MPFEQWFRPVVQVDENIIFLPRGKYAVENGSPIYYVVREIHPLHDGQLIHDFGAVATGQSKTTQLFEDIEMAAGWLGQYRYLLLDDFELVRHHPMAISIGATQAVVTKATLFTQKLDPTLKRTEFFMYEDKPEVKWSIYNTTKYGLDKTRVQFLGWALLVEKMSGVPPQAARINIEHTGVGGKA